MAEGDAAGLSVRLRQEAPIALDVNLACAPGEVLALIGPSGSGKSTILRCIAGLYRPRRGRVTCMGEVWFDDRRRIDVATHRRALGMVFQSYAVFPHMTALENVTAALAHLPRGRREGRAREILERVHLAGLEDRRPAELSGGQRQRVAVARALAREPKVLLLDEPFSAVDKVTRQKLYRELAALRAGLDMPVVFVTHDLDEATLLADRMTVLHHGRTLQHGAPRDILTRPESVEVARLVGLRNVFPGRVAEHRPEAGLTILVWNGRRLEAALQERFTPGQRVRWVIPAAGVILHRRDRPSRGERENPVSGTVAECVALGESIHASLAVDDADGARVFFTLPAHVAARNGIAPGVRARVSLLATAIHLLPDAPEPSRQGAGE